MTTNQSTGQTATVAAITDLIATAPRYLYSRDAAQDTIDQARFAALDDYGTYSRGGMSAAEWAECVESIRPNTLYWTTYRETLAALVAVMS